MCCLAMLMEKVGNKTQHIQKCKRYRIFGDLVVSDFQAEMCHVTVPKPNIERVCTACLVPGLFWQLWPGQPKAAAKKIKFLKPLQGSENMLRSSFLACFDPKIPTCRRKTKVQLYAVTIKRSCAETCLPLRAAGPKPGSGVFAAL